MRFQGSERIVSDLRARCGDSRDKSRLARIRKTHESNIREQLQFQLKLQLLSLASALMVARGTVSRGREVCISKTTTATARGYPAVAIVTEIVKKIVCCSVKDLCANRHAHNQVSAVVPRTIRAFAMRSTLGDVPRVITQVQQCVQRSIGNYNDVAAATTIATRWTTTRYKLLAPESCNTVTSVTPLNVNLGAINKHLKIESDAGARSTWRSGVANLHENFTKQQSAPMDKR